MVESCEFSIRLKSKYGYTNIDALIEERLPEDKEGIVEIMSIGSTASVILIEDDKNLIQDLFNILDALFPYDRDYLHHRTWGDNNGASHLRATFLGQSILLPYSHGKLVKGRWQNVILINHDTRDRERIVRLTII